MDRYLIANYHTHTTRCKHASGSEREYIEAAIKAGMKILGFADHVPCPFEDGFVSGIRMDMEDAADYVNDIRALQKEVRFSYWLDLRQSICHSTMRSRWQYLTSWELIT